MLRSIAAMMGLLAVLWTPIAQSAPCGGFTDVDDANPAHSPFCDSVEWMKLRSITLGCASPPNPPNSYCPNENVTRLQMAAFMYRLGFQNAFLQGGNSFITTAIVGTNDNNSLEMHVNSTRVMRYEPNAISPNVIGGSPANNVTAGVRGATIGGGGVPLGNTDPNYIFEAPNQVMDDYGTVGGGYGNTAGGGAGNTPFATVGGGALNWASGSNSTVAGGSLNTAGEFASVTGGGSNTASAHASTVTGGTSNTASGSHSTVAGGEFNTASGDVSFAAGFRAKAATDGSFVWSDNRAFDFGASAANTFNVRSTGGVSLVVAIDASTGATTQFCNLSPGVVGWQCFSDRDSKENFEPAATDQILDRLAAMPLFTWNVRGIDNAPRMLGPTAQDFHAAFGLGGDDRTVAMLNLEGVALAAIQGLNAKVEDRLAVKDAEIAALRAELAAIRSALATIAGRSTQTAEIAP